MRCHRAYPGSSSTRRSRSAPGFRPARTDFIATGQRTLRRAASVFGPPSTGSATRFRSSFGHSGLRFASSPVVAPWGSQTPHWWASNDVPQCPKTSSNALPPPGFAASFVLAARDSGCDWSGRKRDHGRRHVWQRSPDTSEECDTEDFGDSRSASSPSLSV
jgi:hypothetical protein